MPTYLYFLLWGVFFVVMMRFGCGAHIMGHGHQRKRAKRDGASSSDDAGFPSGTEAQNEHRH